MALLVGVTMLIVATISAALPCAIEDPQGHVSKDASKTSPTSYVCEVRVIGVKHLLWALLLILADVASDRHVGVKRVAVSADDHGRHNWTPITGFTLHPGILASVGIFLLASSILTMVNVKKSSKVLHISAMVPSVFAAISAGIALYVCSVSAANQDYTLYDQFDLNHDREFEMKTPFPIFLQSLGRSSCCSRHPPLTSS